MPSGRTGVEAAGAAGERLDLLADPARLLLAVPVADQPDLLAGLDVGPEGLAEAMLVRRDHGACRGEDVRGRAVVLLEADDDGAGEVLLEAQDVADLGAAPAVDRLVVVADDAEVAVGGGEQAQPEVLRDVGVLVLVDEDVAEPALVLRQHVGVALQDGEDVHQQVAEVAGVEDAQPLLVLGVELGALVVVGARIRRRARDPGSGRGSSSRRSGRRAGAAASASRRCGGPGRSGAAGAAGRRRRGW